MHGVAPHMCDKSHATLLDREAGGRSPALPLLRRGIIRAIRTKNAGEGSSP
jgi:hypothetical protein